MDRCAMAISAAMRIRSPTMASTRPVCRVVMYVWRCPTTDPFSLSPAHCWSGGRAVAFLSIPARVFSRRPWTHGDESILWCSVHIMWPSNTPRRCMYNQWISFHLPPVGHLWCHVHLIFVGGLGRVAHLFGHSDRGSRRPCISKLPHSAPTGGAFLWLCRSFTMSCAQVSGDSSPGMC